MAETPVIKGEERNEFGKGAARRLRRDGRLPGVLYAAHIEPVHFHVDLLEMTALVRKDGVNAILELEIDGEQHLSMVKHIDQNVLTLKIDHIDLLAVKRGEKVEVEVPLIATGEVFPGSQLIQELDTLRVEVDALNIPEEIEFSVEGLQAGTQITAGEITLPDSCVLLDDADALALNITHEEIADVPEDDENEGESEDESEGEGEESAE